MLIRLLSDQIPKLWGTIQAVIEEHIPAVEGEKEDRDVRILKSILERKMECWLSYHEKDKTKVVDGILLTAVLDDEVTKTRALVIYVLHPFPNGPRSSWIEGVEALRKYANSISCNRITAYTRNSSIVKFLEHYGGQTWQYVTLGI